MKFAKIAQEGAGHLAPYQQKAELNRLILELLEKHSLNQAKESIHRR